LVKPETAFNICTFWRIDALVYWPQGWLELFETMLAARNHVGLLSVEDTHPVTMWGNSPADVLDGGINGAVSLGPMDL
jgi:hypothetical protein